MPPSPAPLPLRSGPLECVLCPGIGGSIGRLSYDAGDRTVALLRPASAAAMASGPADGLGCFPLVPFSNRIAGGRFRFGDRSVALPCPPPHAPHAIHGHGWSAPWRVVRAEAAGAVLEYRHTADAWPWDYRAIQTVTLSPDGLTMTLAVINESDAPMPAGFGLHPYFVKPRGTVLTARTGGVWRNGPTLLPTERAPPPPAWDFAAGRAMDTVTLDNGFFGWDGTAALAWPALGLRLLLRADAVFGHLVVYAPPGEDYLCVEPVSHMTDAVNRPEEPDHGMAALAPGARLEGTIAVTVTPLMGGTPAPAR